MFSGRFSYTLSAAAVYVLRSLMERPELRTAEEIAGAPQASAEIDAGAARAGLRELRQQGLAAEDVGGRWHVTDSGCEAHQRAWPRAAGQFSEPAGSIVDFIPTARTNSTLDWRTSSPGLDERGELAADRMLVGAQLRDRALVVIGPATNRCSQQAVA